VQTVLGDLTLSDIATCPDEVREYERDHKSKGYEMSPACQMVFPQPSPKGTFTWHYINIPITLTDPTDADIKAACKNACVLSKIDEYGKVFGDSSKSKEARLQALSFIAHFIGDVHQPLHAAVRDNDGGGNAEHVKIDKMDTTLHHAWDEPLVAHINADPQALAVALNKEIASARKEGQSKPNDWAIQSWRYAKANAYPGVPAANGSKIVATLDANYEKQATPVIRQQLARAGVHLAQFITEHAPKTSAKN
jgi:hypothetical protein